MKTFEIKDLSEEQLIIIKSALDLYTRIGVGQFYTLAEPLTLPAEYCWDNNTPEEYTYKLEAARNHLQLAANILMDCPKSGNGSHGIFNEKVNEKARIGFDLFQVIDCALANRTKVNPNIFVRSVCPCSKKEKLINVITNINESIE